MALFNNKKEYIEYNATISHESKRTEWFIKSINNSINDNESNIEKIYKTLPISLKQYKNDFYIDSLLKEFDDLLVINKRETKKNEKLKEQLKNLKEDFKKYTDELIIPIDDIAGNNNDKEK